MFISLFLLSLHTLCLCKSKSEFRDVLIKEHQFRVQVVRLRDEVHYEYKLSTEYRLVAFGSECRTSSRETAKRLNGCFYGPPDTLVHITGLFFVSYTNYTN